MLNLGVVVFQNEPSSQSVLHPDFVAQARGEYDKSKIGVVCKRLQHQVVSGSGGLGEDEA